MPKIRVKCENFSTGLRSDILKILNNFNVRCSKLISASQSEFSVICHDNSDVDKIFSDECLLAVNALGCKPVMPLFLKAKRSVIIRRLDNYIYDSNTEAIVNELHSQNDWLSITDINKFPNSNFIKVTCKNQDMASRCLMDGLIMFQLYVSPRDIKEEEYFDVLVCYRCFTLNDHPTNFCDKSQDYVVCSLCSGLDHDFKTCPSTNARKCINCAGSHSTLSFSCPTRKSAIKSMKDAKQRGAVGSYANATGAPPGAPDLSNVFSSIDWRVTRDMIVRSATCVMIASHRENTSPGCFDDVLNDLLIRNSLPKIDLGDLIAPTAAAAVSTSSSANDVPVTAVCESAPIDDNINVSVPAETNVGKNDEPLISIFKKKSIPNVSRDNLAELHRSGHVYFESCEGLPQVQDVYLSRLLENPRTCEAALKKIRTKDFRAVKGC